VREQFGVVPDPWQDEVLAAFPRNQRLAMKACKGPGKTAVLAWLAWNFLVVNQEPQDRRDQRERRQPRRRAVGRDGEVAGEVAAAQRRLQVDARPHLRQAPAADLVDERPQLGEVGRPGEPRPDAGRPAQRLHPVHPRRIRAASPTR
jgi:hypothetical protein